MWDLHGELVFGFAYQLDLCSVLESEMWVVYHGLSIVGSKGVDRLVVESNSRTCIDLIEDVSITHHSLSSHLFDRLVLGGQRFLGSLIMQLLLWLSLVIIYLIFV